MSLLHPRAVQKKISLEYEIDDNLPSFVEIDPLRIKQILMNLMTNAIKFTKEGKVTLRVKRHDEHLLFQVSDTEIGISQDQIDKIFQEFQQVENTYVKTQEGTGLGLALVKKFVDLMQGKIEVESELGKGTTFSVYIPLKEGQTPIEQTQSQEVIPLYANINKLLIAEANKMNQLVIGGLLTKLKIQYEFANNGVEAHQMAKANPYDLILMDISMPQMNGFDATAKIREFDQNTTIFCLSANVFNNDRERAIDCGMNEFLEKPIKREKLIALLNEYFPRQAA